MRFSVSVFVDTGSMPLRIFGPYFSRDEALQKAYLVENQMKDRGWSGMYTEIQPLEGSEHGA